jgi:anti-sigma factor RsiW
MKRVEQMIKYLSGDLSPEESLAFERELSENPQLKEEFSNVSLAYSTISDQLKIQDEEVFTAALSAAMNRSESKSGPGPVTSKRKNRISPWWYPLML